MSWGATSSLLSDLTGASLLGQLGFSNYIQGISAVQTANSVWNYLGQPTLWFMTAANFWANTANKIVTTDTLNATTAFVTLTPSGSSIPWDMSTGINFQVTLTTNSTLLTPTNLVAGRSGVLKITQNGTGGWTLGYNPNYYFDGDVAFAVGTTASKSSILNYVVVDSTHIFLTLVGVNSST